MRAVLQRVEKASVEIDGEVTASCGQGLLILLGVANGDTEHEAVILADKIAKMRIFNDADGKMNLSVTDINGSALIISNFTLCADYRKGNRPDYIGAADPMTANKLYEYFIGLMRERIGEVSSGVFGADMKVSILNNGPVTITMDSDLLKKKQVTL